MYGEEHLLKERDSMLKGALGDLRSKLAACPDLAHFDQDRAVGEIFPIRDATRVTFLFPFDFYTARTEATIARFRKDGWAVRVKNTWNGKGEDSGTTSNVRLNFCLPPLFLLIFVSLTFC
jgi:hypothetical protein